MSGILLPDSVVLKPLAAVRLKLHPTSIPTCKSWIRFWFNWYYLPNVCTRIL